MRTIDINASAGSGSTSSNPRRPSTTARRGTIFIGPQAQAILRPWLRADLEAYLFQPREAAAERLAANSLREKTTRSKPSQQNRRKANPKTQPGENYDTDSYRRAIAYAIKRVNQNIASSGQPPIPKWHPHQLRHNAATRLRREFGLDVARAVRGHSSPVVTEVYAELDQAKAAEAMARIG